MNYPSIERHKPELRRAIISVLPDFYARDAATRHALYVALTSEQDQAFELALCQQLFHVKRPHNELNSQQTNLFNQYVLPLKGLGDDCFQLNECFAGDKPMTSFNTLYDYDYDDWCFQETARERDFANYQRETEYLGSMYATWGRCLNDSQALVYLTMSTLASYMLDYARTTIDDLIEQVIPHELVEGPDHGITTETGTRWDFRADAKGLEGELKWLQTRCRKQLTERKQYHAAFFAQQAPCVYWLDNSDKHENNAEVLFTNHHSLAAIRLDHFTEDCQPLLTDRASLTGWESQEVLWCKRVIDKEFSYVMDNYDPTVVPFKQKPTIIVSDDAFDDLDNMFDDGDFDDD